MRYKPCVPGTKRTTAANSAGFDVMLEIEGEDAVLLDPIGGNREQHPTGMFIQARPVTIYAGCRRFSGQLLLTTC